MDENGNILIKRIAKTNVYVKITSGGEDNAIANDILKLPGGALEAERPMKLFDMKKFQQVRSSLWFGATFCWWTDASFDYRLPTTSTSWTL